MTNPLIAFLQEILTRLISKSPKFFRVWQYITGAVTAVTGLPGALSLLHITLPHPFDTFANNTVAICGALAYFFAKLPVENTALKLTADGAVIKKTDADKMPFTAQSESKAAVRDGLQSPDTLHDVIN